MPDLVQDAGDPRASGPIFLAGADRSGIGLLGELLERHPRIAMTRRTDFWTRYHGRFGDLRRPEAVERCLRAMAEDRRMKVFGPDRDRVLADLAATPTYPALFASMQRQRMERMGKSRWGDKSLGSERHAELIFDSFPTARMIHVVRDPRDRYASQKFHRGNGRGGVGAGAAMWSQSVRLAERHLRRYPDRYAIVRYESLVGDPEATLRMVCDFIGEEYASELLDLEVPADAVATTPGPVTVSGPTALSVPGPGPIHGRSVGRFRGLLRPEEVAVLQLAAGRRMGRFGYATERPGLVGAARLRFGVVDLPVHAVQMAVWGPWARLRRLAGRPSPRG
jgi:hypothetical protein